MKRGEGPAEQARMWASTLAVSAYWAYGLFERDGGIVGMRSPAAAF